MYWKMLNELPLKNLLILLKALIDENGVTLGMSFFEAHVEWSICKLQETPKISYLSIEIKL